MKFGALLIAAFLAVCYFGVAYVINQIDALSEFHTAAWWFAGALTVIATLLCLVIAGSSDRESKKFEKRFEERSKF